MHENYSLLIESHAFYSYLATAGDITEIVALENKAWPSGCYMRASLEMFKTRVDNGLVVVTREIQTNELVGYLSYFCPKFTSSSAIDDITKRNPKELIKLKDSIQRWEYLRTKYAFPKDWHQATDNGCLNNGEMHDPNGDVLFGIGLTTNPDKRGLGVASFTLKSSLKLTASIYTKCRYFIAIARLPGFARNIENDIDKYLQLKNLAGEPVDYCFRAQVRSGAVPISYDGMEVFIAVKNAMIEDEESERWGVFIVNPIYTSEEYA